MWQSVQLAQAFPPRFLKRAGLSLLLTQGAVSETKKTGGGRTQTVLASKPHSASYYLWLFCQRLEAGLPQFVLSSPSRNRSALNNTLKLDSLFLSHTQQCLGTTPSSVLTGGLEGLCGGRDTIQVSSMQSMYSWVWTPLIKIMFFPACLGTKSSAAMKFEPMEYKAEMLGGGLS